MILARVGTGAGFSKLKNFQTLTQIKNLETGVDS